MRKFFTQHPESVGETYWQHLAVALSFAGQLFVAAFAALIHAVFPACFEKTASRMVSQLHHRIAVSRRGSNPSIDGISETQLPEDARQS